MSAPPLTKVLRGGRLLDPVARRAEPTDILILGERIAELGPPGLAAPAEAQVIDARDRLVIPGLVDTHTHGHGPMAKGLLGDRATLETFLAGAGPLIRPRTTEDKYLGGLVNAIEMIEKGVTTCLDMFTELPVPSLEGVAALGRAYDEVGIRAVIAPMMADRTLFEALPGLIDAIPEPERAQVLAWRAAPWEASIAACRQIIEQWPFDRQRIRPGLAPTIPLHCSDAFLQACRRLADEHDLPMQIHLAETKVQALSGVQRYGCSLTAHLDRLGVLGQRLSVAHAVWIDDEDMRRLAATGTSVVHNPASNLRLGSGLAPIAALADHGVNLGLGTDACNTSDHLNMFEAQRLASFVSRVSTFDTERWLGPDDVFRMATTGSATAIGDGSRIGRIAPGHLADIVLLDLGHVHYWPLNDPLTQLVFSENGAAVTDVLVGGRQVLVDRRLPGIDVAAIRRKVETAAARLHEASTKDAAFIRSIEGPIRAFARQRVGEPYHVCRHLGCSGARRRSDAEARED